LPNLEELIFNILTNNNNNEFIDDDELWINISKYLSNIKHFEINIKSCVSDDYNVNVLSNENIHLKKY